MQMYYSTLEKNIYIFTYLLKAIIYAYATVSTYTINVEDLKINLKANIRNPKMTSIY